MRANQMRLEAEARAENVGLFRIAVATFAASLGFGLADVEEIKVMVSEAVSNAIVHGYGGEGGAVSVAAQAVEGGMEIVIRDDGVGIADIEKAREPSFSTDPERMGLGFAFMESFSDSLEVESAPGRGTTVRLKKLRAQGVTESSQGAS